MARVKRGTTKLKHRKKVLARTKGFRGRLSSKERAANEALAHAGNHAFQDRRKKKGEFRKLWSITINASSRTHGSSYSRLMHALKKKHVGINRKMLADIAENHPETFERILKTISSQ